MKQKKTTKNKTSNSSAHFLYIFFYHGDILRNGRWIGFLKAREKHRIQDVVELFSRRRQQEQEREEQGGVKTKELVHSGTESPLKCKWVNISLPPSKLLIWSTHTRSQHVHAQNDTALIYTPPKTHTLSLSLSLQHTQTSTSLKFLYT